MLSPFYAFYRLNQEWVSDIRILLLSLTASKCVWRRRKTTHESPHWTTEAGGNPSRLLWDAEETNHSKCTLWRTWFLFPCHCLHSLMLIFIFCVFLGLYLLFNIHCHCNPTTWLSWHNKSMFLRNPKQPQSFFLPLCQRPWSTSCFLFFLKLVSNTAMMSEWNLLYMSDQKVKSRIGGKQNYPHIQLGKLSSQWQKEHVSTTVTLQKEHYFYSQFSKIWNRVETTLETTICHHCMVDSPWTKNGKRQKYVYDPQDV